GMANAIVKQFAPSASIPPSAKKSAWMARTAVMPITADHRPRRMASKTPPTGCTVVPPGAGMLNIITVKQNAAPIARWGTCLDERDLRTRAEAIAHIGSIAAPAVSDVTGLIAESGMCKGPSGSD